MRIVIIGGSDAGISAALRAHELDPSAEIAVLLADRYPNWSVCGLPFYLSGETPDWRSLAHRTEFPGIEILCEHRVEEVDHPERRVQATTPNGTETLHYDRVIVATGAEPVRPRLAGAELLGVHFLHTMGDALAIQQQLDTQHVSSAVVVGAGYIGVEMADALRHRGLRVALISRSDPVFPSVHPSLGHRIEEELRAHGVTVIGGGGADRISAGRDGELTVSCSDGRQVSGEAVILAAGVRPVSRLAAQAGAATGVAGAIAVNRRMETAIPGLLAAGDCVETWHRVLEQPVYLPLGTTAHKQGRIAGEVCVGGDRQFAGSVGTQVVKVFDLAVGRTGLRDRDAREAGFDPLTTEIELWDHKAYYPGAQKVLALITGDRRTGRLLGAQLLGHCKSEVAKRIDVFATALFHAMTVDAISDLDLSYTPPFSSPWDLAQAAAQHWMSKSSSGNGVSAVDKL